ncbi:MAG TPA: gliding motility lipoprotein GldD [Salinimicrobium sp.]|nr:gliding motility lipoprotein GldD [Salinimicrobium sp.]
MKKIFSFLLIIAFYSCTEDKIPKPHGFLALDYPEPEYSRVNRLDCPFSFEKNKIATLEPATVQKYCWHNLQYNLLEGTIFLTYQPVENNLDSLLRDAQKLPLQHTVKADIIEGDIYTNEYNKTYGMFYEVRGDAASQAQFYLTDSTKHFLTGSVYFNAVPNFDSILPAASYIKNDMRHLMETVKWETEK